MTLIRAMRLYRDDETENFNRDPSHDEGGLRGQGSEQSNSGYDDHPSSGEEKKACHLHEDLPLEITETDNLYHTPEAFHRIASCVAIEKIDGTNRNLAFYKQVLRAFKTLMR